MMSGTAAAGRPAQSPTSGP